MAGGPSSPRVYAPANELTYSHLESRFYLNGFPLPIYVNRATCRIRIGCHTLNIYTLRKLIERYEQAMKPESTEVEI